jgi:hypothetical protein
VTVSVCDVTTFCLVVVVFTDTAADRDRQHPRVVDGAGHAMPVAGGSAATTIAATALSAARVILTRMPARLLVTDRERAHVTVLSALH